MLNKLRNAPKSVKFSQYAFFISVLLYFLECLFIRGLFSNVYLLMTTLILGCISGIIALFKKTYLFTIIDAALIAVCIVIFMFLTSL